MKTTHERFWEKVEAGQNECWDWMAGKTAAGYGRLGVNGKMAYAHRLVYEELVGPIPPGLTIDHLCRNRACVNPKHLEPVSICVNVLRGEGRAAKCARQTHCLRGHEFTPENTWRNKYGHRTCKACNRASAARFRLKNHEVMLVRMKVYNARRYLKIKAKQGAKL